ncbi:diacylglycerol kinase family protein [Naasia sp. SYSU D00948]|uniref:diacylglycerol/lipid kinase family protein n=1 Tax=Naasia sp. SYSU D00948 TaxID=2817379 RepID=UPI001B308C60|nr:diacylglycerol kinase family protein [Naasia sp. SYSU D00948]
MPERRLLIAGNPAASFGRELGTADRVGELLRREGHEATVLERRSMQELAAAASAELHRSRPDAVVVVGGDGMVHAGAQLVAQTDVPLGIVPAGTGNDVARGLGIPLRDPGAAVRILLDALDRPPRRIDALRAAAGGSPPVWVVGAVSAGFDALVTERANAMRRPRGASRYTVALVRELAALRPVRYRLVVDGAPRSADFALVSVANNGWIGGGMQIVPGARLDDGELDLLLVTPVGRLRFLALFPKVFRGRHTELPMVRLERARSVRIDADVPLPAYGDGERLGVLPLDVEVVPRALRILAP